MLFVHPRGRRIGANGAAKRAGNRSRTGTRRVISIPTTADSCRAVTLGQDRPVALALSDSQVAVERVPTLQKASKVPPRLLTPFFQCAGSARGVEHCPGESYDPRKKVELRFPAFFLTYVDAWITVAQTADLGLIPGIC